MKEIETLQDLLEFLTHCTSEQLNLPVQIIASHPVEDFVRVGQQGICIGTVNELEIKYFRSVKDNKRNGNELVILTDGNPHGEDGATLHEQTKNGWKSIFPENHEPSCDWTGPAQKIADANPEFKKSKISKATIALLNKRTK